MCGIIGYTGYRNSAETILSGLFSLEYRGYDSAGLSVFDGDIIKTVKSAGKVRTLKTLSEKSKLSGHTGAGHTRWATHGAPTSENAHPHTVGKITLVHNGIIENYAEIKAKLRLCGCAFRSETDTEVAAALINEYFSVTGDPLTALRNATAEIKGSYAFAVLCEGFPDNVFAARSDSPLIIGIGEDENFIASDITAILKYTKKYIVMESGEFAVIDRKGARLYDKSLSEIKREPSVSAWDIRSAEKGGYPHFMLKEINEEPRALSDVFLGRIKNGVPDFSGDGGNISGRLSRAKKIFTVACGTAMHAGLFGKYMTEKLARRPCEAELASEFRYKNPILDKNDAVIIISQSGETADSLAALRLAKKHGAYTLGIVNAVASSVAREADDVIYTRAGPEIAVASTKAFTVQAAVMCLIAASTALSDKAADVQRIKDFTFSLSSELPSVIGSVISQSDRIKEVASRIAPCDNAFFIGRGIDRYAAEEGSLKLKEISYIHSEAYPAGELKHGTLSLIGEGVPVIASASLPDLYGKTKASLSEVKARGALTVLVTAEGTAAEGDADFIIPIRSESEITTAIAAVTVYQLLAYHTAVLRKTDVDMPKNLAKSVTVE